MYMITMRQSISIICTSIYKYTIHRNCTSSDTGKKYIETTLGLTLIYHMRPAVQKGIEVTLNEN